MRKPTMTALLAASVVAGGAGFAVAQQDTGMEIGAERPAATAGQQDRTQAQAQNQKTITGEVVALQQYLQQQAQAGQADQLGQTNQPGQRNPLMQGRQAHPMAPKAIVSQDGEIYVVLGVKRVGQQAGSGWQSRSGQGGLGADSGLQTQADSQNQRQAGAIGGMDSDEDLGAAADLSGEVNADADQGQLSVNLDENTGIGDEAGDTPGLERHTDRADNTATAEAQADEEGSSLAELMGDENQQDKAGAIGGQGQGSAQARGGIGADAGMGAEADPMGQPGGNQVYGFARPATELQVGQRYQVTGEVLERSGLKGIVITQVSPARAQTP